MAGRYWPPNLRDLARFVVTAPSLIADGGFAECQCRGTKTIENDRKS
jgi:hypothetical protein